MYYVVWLIAGFVLLGVSGYIEGIGDYGATAADRLPAYFLALGALIAAGFCFVKAGSGIWKALREQTSATPVQGSKPQQGVRPARRLADSEYAAEDETTEFNADDALARYMARRDTSEVIPDASVAPRETGKLKPSARPSFGRKVS